jgi:hypothetical protein
MQKEEGASMDPWSICLYGMKAPLTREKYTGRLAKFFDFIGLRGKGKERARAFTKRGKKEPSSESFCIIFGKLGKRYWFIPRNFFYCRRYF